MSKFAGRVEIGATEPSLLRHCNAMIQIFMPDWKISHLNVQTPPVSSFLRCGDADDRGDSVP